MATLRDLSDLNGSARGQAALGILLENAPMLRFLERESAFELDATSFDYMPVDDVANVQTRAIGGAFTATDKTPPPKQFGTLAIYGDKQNIDISHIADAERGLHNMDVWLERQMARKMRDAAKKIDTQLFQGSGAGGEMKGLSKILDGVTTLPGYTGKTATIDAKDFPGGVVGGYDLSDRTKDSGFLESIFKVLPEVDSPDAIVMNRSLYARLHTIAREYKILGETTDIFGRRLNTFDGVAMVVVDDSAIPLTEPNSAATPANVTTSLYIVNLGEMRFSLVTNSGLYYKEWDHLETKESNQEMFEMRIAWKIEDDRSVRRVRNLKV